MYKENFVEKEMSDNEFADYLNYFGDWSYKSYENHIPYTYYLDEHLNIIAVVFYNNEKCTRKIFISEAFSNY